MSLQASSFGRTNRTYVVIGRLTKIFELMIMACWYFYAPRKKIGGAYSRRLVRSSVSPSVCQSNSTSVRTPIRVRPNFVIWSRISKLFYRNDHHLEITCRAQHLGSYLEGQGHSMALQQNRVRPITLLFENRIRKYFIKMITILRRRVARNI